MGFVSWLRRRFSSDPNDVATLRIMRRVLRRDSCCVDVGASQGSILRHIVRLAPQGKHLAIEPIPALATRLAAQFPSIRVFAGAASDRWGTTRFHHFPRRHGFSGFRRADIPETPIEIEVPTETLDNLIQDRRVAFLKVDVEGAEELVFRGAVNVLRHSRPTIVFEHGVGGADLYGTRPGYLHSFLCGEFGYQIALLRVPERPLSFAEFADEFRENGQYMFVANVTANE